MRSFGIQMAGINTINKQELIAIIQQLQGQPNQIVDESETGDPSNVSFEEDSQSFSKSFSADCSDVPDGVLNEELLVEEIRKYECIWNTRCRGYKDSTKKNNAWSELASLFGKEGKYHCVVAV